MTGNTIVAIAVGVVFLILLSGLYVMFKGGETSLNWSNRLMRYRIVAQFIAIMIIMAVLYFGRG